MCAHPIKSVTRQLKIKDIHNLSDSPHDLVILIDLSGMYFFHSMLIIVYVSNQVFSKALTSDSYLA